MTAIALPRSILSEAGSVASDVARRVGGVATPTLSQIGLGAVDMAGRSVEAFEQGLVEFKNITDEAVPAAVRFVGSLLLPEILNFQIARVASMATKLGTTALTLGGNGMLNTVTFGAPTWLKTIRDSIATSNETLQQEWNSGAEYLARCLAENADRKILKDDLIQYVEMRKQLHRVEHQDGADSPEAQQVQRSLMQVESSLKDFKDYQTVKAALDRGLAFVQENFDQIITLAEKTADSIIKRAENFYTDRIGSIGGKIEGSYKNMGTDAERLSARNELRDRIATKLKQVFANELEKDEVRQNLRAVRAELLESFGAYREGLLALSYVGWGAAYYSGGLAYLTKEALEYAGGMKDATVAYLREATSEGVRATGQFMWDHTFGAVAQALRDFWAAITPDMPPFIKRQLGF